ncbi:hypothetical protein [Streptantibioticus ferralitis]|uniref:Uncharacterized protein n=1 Tax=Streptantibioticus ferralitis TaxID=236510 RepID=A0ABT5Z1E1_9ACTN|nr:hypothetical protein [Streptantibioticus ferralitis]MDF2257624.1 hypothetical protein [Streptantibioticus ferralitis]
MSTPEVRVPALEPVPVEGCRICAAAARRRETARKTASVISVRACGITISQHPHENAPEKGAA